MFGIIIAVFCVWSYKAKTQFDLNMRLLAAVRKSDVVAARLLLAHGADPNIRDMPQGKMSLWQQIQNVFDPISERRIKTDPTHTIKIMSWHIRTVLEMAVFPGKENAPLVKALLDAGARPDHSSYDSHETPLMWAVLTGQPDTVQTLLDHGANPLARDNAGQFPIHYIGYRRPYSPRDTQNTAQDIQIVGLLVARGTDIDAADNKGLTLLMNSIGYTDASSLTKFLIMKGVDVNARSNYGGSALLQATFYKCIETTRLLLEHGAEVNMHDKSGDTPLGIAADIDCLPIIAMLLARGAKVDPVDKHGDTPLTVCLVDREGPTMLKQNQDYPNIIAVLIAHGADVNHRNEAGKTALAIARGQNFTASIRLLLAAGARR